MTSSTVTVSWFGAQIQAAKARFPINTRVEMSEDGLKQFPRQKGKKGTVVGHSRDGAPRILWDGLRSETTYAPWFVRSTR